MKETTQYIYSYSEEEAVEDGVLRENPRKDCFNECSIVTSNLFDAIEQKALRWSQKRVFEVSSHELFGALMNYAKNIYSEGNFEGDTDKDFFIIPADQDGMIVWFLRNESGKLTAMLPEDY